MLLTLTGAGELSITAARVGTAEFAATVPSDVRTSGAVDSFCTGATSLTGSSGSLSNPDAASLVGQADT